MKLQNGGMLGLDMSRNVSRISNSSLQQCCDGPLCLVVHIFCFKRTCEGTEIIIYVGWEICEKNISTIFRVWERWSVTELNVRITWTIGRNYPCRRLFFTLYVTCVMVNKAVKKTLSHLDFQSLWAPLPREFPESHQSWGCRFFSETTQCLLCLNCP